MAYIYLEDLTFKKFRCEFRRDFYGQELLVTITQDSGPKTRERTFTTEPPK